MREILFKAKRKDNGEWVEGFLLSDGMREPEHWFVGSIVIEPYKGTACDEWDITGIALEEIDISSLCQFTGLTDWNGKKIWENDIVENGKQRGKIVHRNCCFEIDWLQYNRYSGKHMTILTQHLFEGRCFASIGNVFDNPELLEV